MPTPPLQSILSHVAFSVGGGIYRLDYVRRVTNEKGAGGGRRRSFTFQFADGIVTTGEIVLSIVVG